MKNWLVYLLGCLLFSFGAKMFIDSSLGTDPLDAMIIGISHHTGWLLGTISLTISGLFLALWSILNKKFPPITCFLTMGGVGYLIDLWNYIGILPFNHWFLLIIGLLTVAFSSALIIKSELGIRIMDLLALTFVKKWTWNFTLAKMLFEIGFISSALLLGGPVGIGTVMFVLLVGTLIEPFTLLLKNI
jgi:uncharacterized membrane protein YczE